MRPNPLSLIFENGLNLIFHGFRSHFSKFQVSFFMVLGLIFRKLFLEGRTFQASKNDQNHHQVGPSCPQKSPRSQAVSRRQDVLGLIFHGIYKFTSYFYNFRSHFYGFRSHFSQAVSRRQDVLGLIFHCVFKFRSHFSWFQVSFLKFQVSFFLGLSKFQDLNPKP